MIKDILELVKQAESTEDVAKGFLTLDSEFRFKCRRCGKCCIHQDTVRFTTRDIFNIAKKLGKTPKQVIREYTVVYIGESSRIPVVHMAPKGPQRRCPLLQEDGRCSVHDCKPTVCAIYPVGRVAIIDRAEVEKGMLHKDNIRVGYMINDIACGSAKRVNTIRSWLARFNILEQDEFFLLWSEVTENLGRMIRTMEKRNCSNHLLELTWGAIIQDLFLDYDTSREFMPQFEASAEKLNKVCQMVRQLDRASRGEAPLPESIAQMLAGQIACDGSKEGVE